MECEVGHYDILVVLVGVRHGDAHKGGTARGPGATHLSNGQGKRLDKMET
jgi:hypothetical protein